MLRLGWHAHACWELRYEGRTLVLDPHDGRAIGLAPPRARADFVVVTHPHFDHNAVRVVEKEAGATATLTSPVGTHTLGPFQVTGHPAFHDTQKGQLRGASHLALVEAGGLRILHLGDLGHELDDAAVDAIGPVDLALVPAGEVFTLSVAEAWRTIEKLEPRVVAPMHYKAPGLALPLHELEAFLGKREPVHVGQSVELEREDLPESQEIWVFAR